MSCLKRSLSIAVSAVMLLAVSGVTSAGMIDKDGMQAWEVCALCHSADGVSRMAKFPKLAGQKALYIEQQFIRFNQGSRQNDGGQMEAITTEVEATDIVGIAAYFSSLPPDDVDNIRANMDDFGVVEKEWFARGEQLFKQGKEGVRACVQCHGDKTASAPWIDRQHRDYLKKQLEDFKSGERAVSKDGVETASTAAVKENFTAVFTDDSATMGALAKRLSEADIDAVSFYLSVTSIARD